MSISEPFVRRPIATSLLMGGIFLVGLVVYPMLPVAPLPQVDFPTIQVSASLPGGSPETMASSVATPLEYQFAQISGLSQMTSTNALGTTQITLQFDLNRNIDAAAQDVQTGIDAAGGQLPKNLPAPPTYKKVNPADSPILILAVHSDVLPVTTVDDYAENILAQQISQIPGIAQVSIGGQQKPAVRVQIDPTKLAALGLQMEDVAGVITAATVDAPKGSINGPKRSLTIYDNDQLLSAAPWNDVVVAYKNGAAVRIRDIGVAVDGPENTLLTAWQNGRKGILLLIYKQPGANVIDAEKRVETLLPHALASVPPSIKVDTVANRTTTISASVRDVEFTLALTIALVVMVIFLFLRSAWATIIPGVTVPLALLGTAAMMYVLNYSLDNLSLMALTIAVGFVVDDAIVMLENIYRHIEAGMSPLDATLKGAGEVGFTILSISISLIAVFIPLLLMGGIIGRLFREFAITMSMTIVISAFVALTLSPTMCALFLRDEKHAKHGRAYMAVERAFDRLLAGYTRGLDFCLDHKRLTLAVFLITVAATVALYIAIPKGFFPQQDTGIISGLSDAPQDISFDEMVRRQHLLLDVVAKDPDIASYGTGIGGGRPINNGFVVIGLKPRDQRSASADQIITRLRPQLAKVPGATLFMQAAQDLNVGGRTSRTQYQYTLQDSDINELNSWAPKLLAALQKLPMLRDVASDQQTSSGMLSLTIDRDQAARFGIQPAAIDQALYDAFGQRQAAQFFTQANSYHVILEITPALQKDPATLNKLYLKSALTGQMVPLSAMTKYDTQRVTYLSINHQGQFPAVTLSFNLAPGAALGQAVDAINRVSAQMRLPATINGNFQGTAQAFQSSLKSQPYLILAALVAVYIILGMLYESYVHPLTILSTLPSAGVGALLVLLIFHIDLSVMALIGIILLIGIVKKNGIMMVDFALQAEREQGLSPHDSIRQACLLRFRPIMMTTMAALLGALPLALGHGTGSELRRPLGYTMVGGLILSQALTLFTTPVVYLYLDELSLWFKTRRGRRHPQADSPPPQPREYAVPPVEGTT
ncbi:MAG TPA: multidrug efflux RND transporter permease subunit [Steroidobacteraceae bacterium]|nr:multidrug efflux RND transporter permease subunit [Steroidobacteraceae bacterium]